MRPNPALLSLALCLALPAAARAETLALHCGQLFDSAAGRSRAEQTIVVAEGKVREVRAGMAAVETWVRGSAYRTGEHVFELDPRDPLGTGFLLR